MTSQLLSQQVIDKDGIYKKENSAHSEERASVSANETNFRVTSTSNNNNSNENNYHLHIVRLKKRHFCISVSRN